MEKPMKIWVSVQNVWNMQYLKEKTMNDLEGAKIVRIREMTSKEAEQEGWDGMLKNNGCRVLELDNGINLYASQDYEGNGPGALFFTDKNKHYAV